MNSENKPLTVITSDMVMFKMKAADWDHLGITQYSEKNPVKIMKAEPGNGTPPKRIAEFSDVSAIFFDDEVELVKPEE